MNAIKFFTTMLMVQLFYGLGITLIVHTLPVDTLQFSDVFSDVADDVSLEDVSERVKESAEQQTNIPLVDVGALVFYSGNILLDLLLNFVFAIPQMAAMLFNGLLFFVPIDSFMIANIQIFFSVMVTIYYFISLIEMVNTIRSGTRIT